MHNLDMFKDKINPLKSSNWVEIKKSQKGNALKPYKIYCRYSLNGRKTYRLSVYIGYEIAELLTWKKGDLITVFFSKSNISQFMLRRSMQGYSLTRANRSNVFTFAFKWINELNIEMDETREMHFDIDDNCLIIDISRLLKGV